MATMSETLDVLWTLALLAFCLFAVIGVLVTALFVSWWGGQEPIDRGYYSMGEWHPSSDRKAS